MVQVEVSTDVEFDFEKIVQKELLPEIEKEGSNLNTFGLASSFGKGSDPKRRTVVCRHWLVGLCQKGNDCAYLHKLDKSRAPLCKYGRKCKIKNCPLKHEDEEEKSECLNYKQGFCYNGKSCRLRHVKRPPDECPALYDFNQSIAEGNVPMSKKRKTHQPNQLYKISLCLHWLEHDDCHFGEECHYAHGEGELMSTADIGSQSAGSSSNANMENIVINGKEHEVFDPTRNQMDGVQMFKSRLPFKTGAKVAYFLCLAPDLQHSMRLARERSYWGVSERMALEINEAFRKNTEQVIIFFYVKSHRAIYGVATVPAPIEMRPSPYSPLIFEFPLRWVHTMRASVRMTSQIKMMSGGAKVMGKTAHDGKISNAEKQGGFEMLLVCLRKPEWNWHLDLRRANLAVLDNTSVVPINTSYGNPLGPDVLFSTEWINYVASGGGSMMPLGGNTNSGRMGGSGGKGGFHQTNMGIVDFTQMGQGGMMRGKGSMGRGGPGPGMPPPPRGGPMPYGRPPPHQQQFHHMQGPPHQHQQFHPNHNQLGSPRGFQMNGGPPRPPQPFGGKGGGGGKGSY